MAIKTVTTNKGSGVDYTPGWHEVTISNAQYGSYNGNRYLDIEFEGYPSTLNARVYEAVNKTTNEEFRIFKWFQYSNAGILEKLESADGKPIYKYDDEASLLNGMPINVLFYKERSKTDGKEYTRIWRDPAPTELEGEFQKFSDRDVVFLKGAAERGLANFNANKKQSNGSIPIGTTQEATIESAPATTAEIPF